MGNDQEYVYQNASSFEHYLMRRSAAREMAFLLPHLHSGMRLLDCGCGPGSITIGLAEAICPGEAIGIDMQTHLIETAQALAKSKGITNVSFQVADINDLPFPDASFDVAVASTVLQHTRDPLRVLKEIRRVLRPKGFVALRDGNWAGAFLTPATPLLTEVLTLSLRIFTHFGANPDYPRSQRQFLCKAGFACSEAFGFITSSGTLDATRKYARYLAKRLEETRFRQTALDQGWATEEKLTAMQTELLAWGERRDAFACFTHFAAIGWVTEQ